MVLSGVFVPLRGIGQCLKTFLLQNIDGCGKQVLYSWKGTDTAKVFRGTEQLSTVKRDLAQNANSPKVEKL